MSFIKDLLKWGVVRGSRDPVTGGITGLTSGSTPLGSLNPTPIGGALEIMPTSDVAMWNTDKTAALTVEVDSVVTFQGRPTLKITIPAGTSGVCKVGTSGANALVPYLWNREDFCLAIMYSGFTGYDMSSTFPPVAVPYLGGAGYADFWTMIGYQGSAYPEQKARQDEWWVQKIKASQWTAAGSPLTVLGDGTNITQQKLRAKLQWTQVSQATDCYIRIGLFGKNPTRKKPTIILSLDDGYSSWYSFIAPLMKHYDMPATMAIDSALVGTANYMTSTQIQALFNDNRKLFDFVNHGVNNQSYNSLGAAAYYATIETTRTYLQGLGITGDGPLHHPYVQGVWGNDLIDLLVSGGYLSARGSPGSEAMHRKDQAIDADKVRWHLNLIAALGSATSLATVNTAVDDVVTTNTFGMINAHDFGATSDTYKWTYADMEQLVGRLASLQSAGTLEVKSWSKWYADLTGRQCDRR